MPGKKMTKEMAAARRASKNPRSYMGRNRMANQVRKRTKHSDMGIYAKRRSPATRPRKV